ncbi:hypothetical protein GUITHDRAFT_115844 [Guillardia theta CCMP2712]|uniref:Uncharacterized protein n=1 Tax=Guillardia theta (strain CCMP2712) TaxID=905079 RepID=L1IPQ8_GUITC|nr:hypothetical protein GUITHDRAFT_115844 [Guillardia theta CCMP2712]EKX38082.1 hypothetical protein GUITHDRAFT_115844 [Guillardia theta CCMP2712]|eukprot:XP_005825062.1 hypothetical protein GUITHDRAFT_115844 [Guillardia theta CCMP2712]
MSKGDVEHSSACSDEEEKERILEFLEFHDMKSSRALEAITETLIPSDHAVASELLARLNLVTQVGVMPSFSDAGARTGYLLKRMIHRSSILAALFLKRETSVMISAKMEQDVCRVISLGGAGGSDAMAMYLLRDYLKSKMILDVMVSDYEVRACFLDVKSLTVLVENALKLTTGHFGILPQMFERATDDCMFVFIDSSLKLWEPIEDLASAHGLVTARLKWSKRILRMQRTANLSKNILFVFKSSRSE